MNELAPAAPSASPAPDEALVGALGAGAAGEEALRTLHRRYAALVFTVAARYVGSATAEDVVQDVFVTLWRKHETFDPKRGTFRSWIAQVTRRRALNELRRKTGAARETDAVLDQVPADALEPDEVQWIAHRREAIRAAVDALPEAQRQALSLAFFDELTHEQIAAVLRTPVGTTKTRIRLALKKLAPVLLLVVAAGAVVVLVVRRQQRIARDERALRMVTASDVVPLRLAPAPGAPAEAHGTYRARPGTGIAVLTTSHLPPLAASETYVAWVRSGDVWASLGPVVVEADGRSLQVAEVNEASAAPAELRVTREAAGGGDAPRGPVVLAWPVVAP